jgi:hypothetical protein
VPPGPCAWGMAYRAVAVALCVRVCGTGRRICEACFARKSIQKTHPKQNMSGSWNPPSPRPAPSQKLPPAALMHAHLDTLQNGRVYPGLCRHTPILRQHIVHLHLPQPPPPPPPPPHASPCPTSDTTPGRSTVITIRQTSRRDAPTDGSDEPRPGREQGG